MVAPMEGSSLESCANLECVEGSIPLPSANFGYLQLHKNLVGSTPTFPAIWEKSLWEAKNGILFKFMRK